MDKIKDLKIKLMLPCTFKIYDPYSTYGRWFMPYGMCVLTNFLRKHDYYVEQVDLSIKFNRYINKFLRKHNYHVEQEDLSIKFNRYVNKFIGINAEESIGLDRLKNKDEISVFLESGEIKGSLERFLDNTLDSVHIEEFNLVGFSIFSFYHLWFGLMFAKRIKERFNIPIVFGGPFINLCGNLYPGIFNFIDYMITGDGSVPLLELIRHLEGKISINDVPNLSFKNNGKLVVNHYNEYPLEDMPVPDFSDLPLKLYEDLYDLNLFRKDILLPYQVTRGCTNRCIFCNNKYINSKLEFKPYHQVVNELIQMKEKYATRRFYFCDDAINNSYEYLEGLCDTFIKERLNIDWYVYARVGDLDKQILEKMKKAGCSILIFGVETGSDRMLSMMNKDFTSEEASTTLRLAYEAGIRNIVNLMPGYPYESHEDANQTVKFIKRNKRFWRIIHVSPFLLMYGSNMCSDPEKYGIMNVSPISRRPFIFSFDELNGLKWPQKQQQQRHSRNKIMKTIRAWLFFRNLNIFLMIFLKSIIIRTYRLCYTIK